MYKNLTVNVIMPVHNEEKTVKEIIERVLALPVVDRLIIINDNSGDHSPEIIKGLAKRDKRISYLSNNANKGKGYSVRRALKEVEKGIVIIQDADLEYYPEDYKKLLPKLADDTIVLGTRMRGVKTGHEYKLAKFANYCLTETFNILYGRRLTDINTCYKLFKKEMLDGITLREDGFLIEPELLIGLVKKGYKVVEVDVRYKGRTYDEGKHITAADGLDQMLYMVKNFL